ncbi:hypothetical protein HanRHA438_Chr13g0625441 [Helianthus annuus]|nr:hypothetical protein HanRHA438_Chr13g0625441 [Helianthus annuus]
METDGDGRLEVAKILASAKPESVVPRLELTGSGHVGKFETFAHYVGKLLFKLDTITNLTIFKHLVLTLCI